MYEADLTDTRSARRQGGRKGGLTEWYGGREDDTGDEEGDAGIEVESPFAFAAV